MEHLLSRKRSSKKRGPHKQHQNSSSSSPNHHRQKPLIRPIVAKNKANREHLKATINSKKSSALKLLQLTDKSKQEVAM